MERDSKKRGLILYWDTWFKLQKLTPLERDALMRLAVPFANPADPNFEHPPDLESVFPDATEDQMRLYWQSWQILEANIRDDDSKLVHKNVNRKYTAFRTNCMRYGNIPPENILPFEEWDELGQPGWRQWDRLGRPVPPPKPITMKDGTTVTVNHGTVTVANATVTDRDGPHANYNSSHINSNNHNHNLNLSFSGSDTRVTETIPPPGAGRFVPPTMEEAQAFARENGLVINVERFYNHYTARGWKGITDWKAAALSWDAQDRAEMERRRTGGRNRVSGPSDEDAAEYMREMGMYREEN